MTEETNSMKRERVANIVAWSWQDLEVAFILGGRRYPVPLKKIQYGEDEAPGDEVFELEYEAPKGGKIWVGTDVLTEDGELFLDVINDHHFDIEIDAAPGVKEMIPDPDLRPRRLVNCQIKKRGGDIGTRNISINTYTFTFERLE